MRPSARRQLERGVSAISISAAGATWSHTADAWRSRVSNLLHISHIIDTDHTLRCVVDRLVTRDVGLTENVHLSVERFIFLDEFDRLAFRVEIVPTAREPSSFLTLVATRTYSSPFFTNIVAV